MPYLYKYYCTECDFSMPYGGFQYVTADNGDRVRCKHPSERYTIEKVLGDLSKNPDIVEQRTGYADLCLCLDCMFQFPADFGFKFTFEDGPRYYSSRARDKQECPKCKSSNIQTVRFMIDKECPKCHKGIFIAEDTGLIS